MPVLSEPVRLSPAFEVPLPDLIQSVQAQGLEGIVAKRRDSSIANPVAAATVPRLIPTVIMQKTAVPISYHHLIFRP